MSGTSVSFSVDPSKGTYGTELKITGSGFGINKGVILIKKADGTVTPVKPKILGEWSDGLIGCSITKTLPLGTYDVEIQPKVKEAQPITEPNSFTFKTPEIWWMSQEEGTYGDQIIMGGRFFGTKKGKILLEYDDSVRKTCKVVDWWMDPTTGYSEVVFVVPKMSPDVYNVVVDPSGTLPPEIEEEDGFTVKAPKINLVEPGSGSVGEEVAILGNYFGSQKGKVYLGYLSKGKPTKKSCSVLSWSDDEIVFTVPTLPAESYDVIVTNSVGSDTAVGNFNIIIK